MKFVVPIAFLSLILSTCGSSDDKVCSPGKVESCPCIGQDDGVQTCLPDGSGWGQCECPCEPDCDGKECGPDGCGESCAPGCDADEQCNASGQCEAIHECSSSGDCDPGYYCDLIDHKCKEEECTPLCTGKCCGDDGCGNQCPDDCSLDGLVCDVGSCTCEEECTPQCSGKCCGDDGCGQECPDACSTEGLECDGDSCGCVAGTYSITFDWLLTENDLDCLQAQVTKVSYEVFQDDQGLGSTTLDCWLSGSVGDLANGSYTLEITAHNDSHLGFYGATESLEIFGADVDLGGIILDPIGTMVFGMTYGPGEAQCDDVGVNRIGYTLRTHDQSQIIYTTDPAPLCWDYVGAIADLALDLYNLELEGLCESDGSVGYYLSVNVGVANAGLNYLGTFNLEHAGGCL